MSQATEVSVLRGDARELQRDKRLLPVRLEFRCVVIVAVCCRTALATSRSRDCNSICTYHKRRKAVHTVVALLALERLRTQKYVQTSWRNFCRARLA